MVFSLFDKSKQFKIGEKVAVKVQGSSRYGEEEIQRSSREGEIENIMPTTDPKVEAYLVRFNSYSTGVFPKADLNKLDV